MKSKNFPLVIGSMIIAGVVVMMTLAGINLSRTVEEFAVIAREDTVQTSDSVIAWSDDKKTVHDPTDIEYVEPLGETVTTGPNTEKILAAAVGAQGMILGVLAVCLVIVISLVVRYLRRDRKQAE